MKWSIAVGMALSLQILSSLWSEPETLPATPQDSTAAARNREPIKAIPLGQKFDPAKVALGSKLFHDPRLSQDGTISCAHCHDLRKGGADGRARPIGLRNAEGKINTPTVFNSGLNFRQFWDGRAATLEKQVDEPLHNVLEMGSTWPDVVRKLRAVPEYSAAFSRIYPDGVVPQNIRDAIAEFERSLLTPNSRFDRFLRGDTKALTAAEIVGYEKFKAYGCASCHQGANIGGNMFEKLGAMADFFADRGDITPADYGRYNVTKREEDRFVFKVPSLRNVARTAPYFHDGSTLTLSEAVRIMVKYQLGRELPAEDIEFLVQFLGTLTGEYGGQPL